MNFEHCESMFNSASIGIILVNQNGIIEMVNKAGFEMFDYSEGELLNKRVECILPDALRKAHVEHRDKYFKKPSARAMGSNVDLYAKSKKGNVFPVEISLGHYKVDNELKAIAFITDVTARKEKEKELKRLKEELEDQVIERTAELAKALAKETEINDMKSRFVSMASHEFRTPLTSVLSSANLAARYVELGQSEKIIKHLERIEESSNNLVGILNDFLSLEKIESGKEAVHFETFNIDMYMREIMDEVSHILKTGQTFNYSFKGIESAYTDRHIFKNVMLNILSNAIKYSEPGKLIDIETESIKTGLRIKVRDYGIGIPKEEQEKLFTKFFRARNVENIQGTGLGLTIVQRYLELINGSIDFQSVEGEGTTFIIEIN